MRIPDDEACEHCGLTYGSLRTDLTYADVFMMLWSSSDDRATWKYKRRATVLGLWMSIKKDMWDSHIKTCDYEAAQLAAVEDLEATYEPDDNFLW